MGGARVSESLRGGFGFCPTHHNEEQYILGAGMRWRKRTLTLEDKWLELVLAPGPEESKVVLSG